MHGRSKQIFRGNYRILYEILKYKLHIYYWVEIHEILFWISQIILTRKNLSIFNDSFERWCSNMEIPTLCWVDVWCFLFSNFVGCPVQSYSPDPASCLCTTRDLKLCVSCWHCSSHPDSGHILVTFVIYTALTNTALLYRIMLPETYPMLGLPQCYVPLGVSGLNLVLRGSALS